MRRSRLLLAVLLAGMIAPGTWLRTPEPPRDFRRLATATAIAFEPTRTGPFTLAGAWEMTGHRKQFGGFSALVTLDGDRFLAGSDTGRRLAFERPDRSTLPGVLERFGDDQAGGKEGRDLESLAIDPDSGTVWGGYEFRKSIIRFHADLRVDEEVSPPLMRDWGGNSGAEALVRFADGRFLVIEERPLRWRESRHVALLFATDPIEDAEPESVRVDIPGGYRPVDATPLEDGRALILLRRLALGIPPGFETAIAVIDIDRRTADGRIPARLLAEFGTAIPQDNYEGMTITDDADGRHVWLISDDNFMALQRTLLLKLRWDQREKARE